MLGFSHGGSTDAIARILSDKLEEQLSTSAVVDNNAGAGRHVAAQALKAAPVDSSVLFSSHDQTISILPLGLKNPGFEPATDVVAVAGFATFVNAFAVSVGTPARSLNESVAWASSQCNKGNVGVPAPTSVPDFAGSKGSVRFLAN